MRICSQCTVRSAIPQNLLESGGEVLRIGPSPICGQFQTLEVGESRAICEEAITAGCEGFHGCESVAFKNGWHHVNVAGPEPVKNVRARADESHLVFDSRCVRGKGIDR